MFRTAKSRRRPRRRSLTVTLVSHRAETLESVNRYLYLAGVASRPVRFPSQSLDLAEFDDAAVIFADELDTVQTLEAIAALRRTKPGPLLVMVTANPARYAQIGLSDPDERMLILPRPAWAWSILDAIRGCIGDAGLRDDRS